nr:NlpC/P60 family protein [Corynebacterium hansenii]
MVVFAPAVSAQPAGGGTHAESGTDALLQKLVREVADRERRVSDLETKMGGLREDANRAFADLQIARDEAKRLGGEAEKAKKTFGDTRDDLRGAQGTFDEVARAAMRQGHSLPSALNGAGDAAEVLDRSSTLRREADKQGAVVNDLDRARTKAANAESSLRQARTKAEKSAVEAERLHGEADRVYKEAERLLGDERVAYAAAVIQRDAARAALDAARRALDAYARSGDSNGGRTEDQVVREAADGARDGVIEGGGNDAASDAADAAESNGSGDAGAAATGTPQTRGGNRTNAPSATTTQDAPSEDSSESPSAQSTPSDPTTTRSARPDARTGGSWFGDGGSSQSNPGATGDGDATEGTGGNATTVQTAPPANPESPTPSAGDRSAKIETVISRAMAQVGVPYAWGGGDANGPTKGIRDGGNADAHGDYDKVGFDCSGLTLYAYAGIGISLPHYTGYQYQRGTHHPASDMQRGDLIFYGPNGHGHVAIYLGNGQMIEAPQSGSNVRVTAVRYNGMTPNVVRLV